MPTYEYKCDACGHAFEQFQSMSAAQVKKCPHCGKSKVKRLLGTGAGIIFKGSGFYITDYRGEGYKKAAESDKGGTSASGGGESRSGAKSEPAAAPKPDSKSSDSSSSGGSSSGGAGKGE